MVRCLTLISDSIICQHQAGFYPGQGGINLIFTHRQFPKPHAQRRLTVVVIFDLRGTFDSVDWKASLGALYWTGMPRKFVSFLCLFDLHQCCLMAYGEPWCSFGEGRPIYQFLFNFVMDKLLEDVLDGLQDIFTEMVHVKKVLCYLGHGDSLC